MDGMGPPPAALIGYREWPLETLLSDWRMLHPRRGGGGGKAEGTVGDVVRPDPLGYGPGKGVLG